MFGRRPSLSGGCHNFSFGMACARRLRHFRHVAKLSFVVRTRIHRSNGSAETFLLFSRFGLEWCRNRRIVLCGCVRICLCVFVCVFPCVCLRICLLACLPACLCVCARACLSLCVCVCVYVCLSACVCVCVRICLSVRLVSLYNGITHCSRSGFSSGRQSITRCLGPPRSKQSIHGRRCV